MNLKAFISCSFNKSHKELRAFFCEVIKSCGFDCILLEDAQGIPVPEKIKRAITESDLLIAIIFENASDYILNEIGMAYSLGKEILVVKERTADVGGITPGITDFSGFDKEEFWLVVPQLISLLAKKQKQLRNDFSNEYVMIRKHVKSVIKITKDTNEVTTEVNLLNLSDKLAEVNHGLIAYNEWEKTKLQDLAFNVRVLTPGIDCKIVRWTTSNSQNCRVQFIPILRSGDSVRYVYYQKLANCFPFTMKELDELISNNQYHLKTPFCEKNYTISTPTEYLELRLVFPESYKVVNETIEVNYYKADIPMHDEMERIRKGKFFRIEDFAGQVTLCLQVPYPKLFGRYSVRWQPDA